MFVARDVARIIARYVLTLNIDDPESVAKEVVSIFQGMLEYLRIIVPGIYGKIFREVSRRLKDIITDLGNLL